MDKNEYRRTLRSEYEEMTAEREVWLDAAKIAAKYTIPAIMPEDSSLTKTRYKQTLKSPNQSVGADGINNLASKMTMTLLPPNQTFYRFTMDEASIQRASEMAGADKDEFEVEVNKGLAKIEKFVLDYIEQSSDRVCLGEAFKHLYITGNVLLVYEAKRGLKYYPLSRYCIKRDYYGNVQKVITEEKVGFLDLPESLQEQILKKHFEELEGKPEDEREKRLAAKEFTLYTGFKRCKKVWKVWQEVEDFDIEENAGQYPLDICPVIPLRYVRVDGESYGRGLVEEYFGDISYLDTICLAIKEAALAGSKLIMLVNPAGTTKIRKIAKAKNGDFVEGNINDIQPLQANKYNDLQVAQAEAQKIEQRLQRIFVMKAAIQRDGERVTAEEIRQMAADLEEALGNHYSLMAKEFQQAYIKLIYFHLRKQKNNNLPDLINNKEIQLTITTGLEALGRTSDLNKLVTFFDVLGKLAQVAQGVGAKTEPLISKVASAMNMDVSGMFYTEEEKAKMQEQAQQQALMEKATPNLVNQAGAYMQQQQEPREGE